MTNHNDAPPGDVNALFQQAVGFFQQGQFAEAEVLAEKILAASPAHADTYHLSGLIAIQRQRYDLARERIARAIEINPDQAFYHYNLGLALHSGGNSAEALTAYRQGIHLNPGFVEAYINCGMTLSEQGRLDEALAAYQKALELAPDRAVSHYNLGNVLNGLGRLEEALSAYRQAIRFDPDFAQAHNNCGYVLIGLERLEEALQACERAIQLNPRYTEAHNNHGNILKGLNRAGEALAAIKRALQLEPNNAEAHNNQGNVLTDLGRHEEALAAYDQAIRLMPEYAEAHNNRGNALQSLGHREEALAAYDRAIGVKPEYANAYNNRGDMLLALGKVEEAGKAFRDALEHNPDLVSARYFLSTMGMEEVPSQSPQDYIAKLFDDCSDSFDRKLVDELKYRVPDLLFDAVSRHTDADKKLDILDLGCGTGLCGVAFSELINQLVGVDLAPRMLLKARERGLYTDLIEDDVCHALDHSSRKFDLILSADVFVYIGKLEEVFERAAERLHSGGLFAFSIEVNNLDEDSELRLTGRYAHSLDYIHRLAEVGGFEELARELVTSRYEKGEPVAGSVIVLRLAA